MTNRPLKHNKGFSLVELIIVIATMGLLIAIITPQLIQYNLYVLSPHAMMIT